MKFEVELPDSQIKCWKESINIFGQEIPTFSELAFKEKWNSIYYRYESARNFLLLAMEPGYEKLYKLSNCSDESKKYFELRQQINFYEAALLNYNMLIDYSWQLVYFCFEFVAYYKDEKIDLDAPLLKEESKEILKKLEKNVLGPTNDESPLLYFKTFRECTEYNEIYDLISSFWNSFKDTNVRKLYNRLKHCGNLLYEEENEFRTLGIKCKAVIEGNEILISVDDIKERISLKKSMEELFKFDNESLMGYLTNLLVKLKPLIKLGDLAYL